FPTVIGWTTAFVRGLTRDTVSPSALVTQYAPSPAATAVGVAPTPVSATRRPECASTTASESLATDTTEWPLLRPNTKSGITTAAAAITPVSAARRTARCFHARRSTTCTAGSCTGSTTDVVRTDACGASRSAR